MGKSVKRLLQCYTKSGQASDKSTAATLIGNGRQRAKVPETPRRVTKHQITHSAELDFPPDKAKKGFPLRIVIPKPPEEEGWEENWTEEYDWPHRYVNEKKWECKITHKEGSIIAREYVVRIKKENARILSMTQWRRPIVVEEKV